MPTPANPISTDRHESAKKEDALDGLASHPSPDEAATASYAANGVPYCEMCGQQICSDGLGRSICPYEVVSCPVKS